jgi:GntR family transcriptional regulator / MocR family aminotransferase
MMIKYSHSEVVLPKFPGGALLIGFYIDRSSHVPIYRQIDTELRRLILEGALEAKQKLPSTRELAMEFGVCRITVKSVYEQLVAEGYAQAKTGSGNFISEGLDFETTPKITVPKKILG